MEVLRNKNMSHDGSTAKSIQNKHMESGSVKLQDKHRDEHDSNEQAEYLLPDNLAPLSSMNVVEGIREDQNIHTNINSEVHSSGKEERHLPTISKPQVKVLHDTTLSKRREIRGLDDTRITAISGALAGFLSGIVVCPLDVTKTRLQAQGLRGAENPYYKGILGTMNTIVKDEGVKGLYKGLAPILLGYFPTWTIYFSVYEFSKKFYPKWFPHSDFIAHSCAAITAGAASTSLTNPIWVVKTRLMLQTNLGTNSTHYKGTIDAFRCIWKQEGIRTFYTGLVPSLLGLFHVAIHFPVYEKLKIKFRCYSHNDGEPLHSYNIHLPNLIMASSVSKMIASSLTYPHEILRTRMQLKSIASGKVTNKTTNKSISDMVQVERKLIPLIKTTYRNEGMRGFYSGFTANLIRTVPASAITLVSFEYVRNKLASFHG